MPQINVSVKFFATLKHYFPQGTLRISLERGATLEALLNEINKILTEKNIPYQITDREYLILIDGVHISAKKGIHTQLINDCNVTIIPLIHGGYLQF